MLAALLSRLAVVDDGGILPDDPDLTRTAARCGGPIGSGADLPGASRRARATMSERRSRPIGELTFWRVPSSRGVRSPWVGSRHAAAGVRAKPVAAQITFRGSATAARPARRRSYQPPFACSPRAGSRAQEARASRIRARGHAMPRVWHSAIRRRRRHPHVARRHTNALAELPEESTQLSWRPGELHPPWRAAR